MKRVLFSGLIVVSSLHLAAQSWAPVGASWTYELGSWVSPDSFLLVIEAVDDTTIAGRTCTRLDVVEGGFGCYVLNQFHHESNDSLYYWDEEMAAFRLFFRWDALPGDAWSLPLEVAGLGPQATDTLDWTVTDTSTVVNGGLALRQLEVDVIPRNWLWQAGFSGWVTESLGPMGAPFVWKLEICDGELFAGLRCYSDSTITWQNPDVPQCALGTSVPELNAQAFRVAPTLLDRGEALTVDLGDRLDAEGLTIRLTDLSGRMVREAPIAGTRTTLQVDASGAFLVVLLKNGRPIGRQRVVVR